jgi:N-acetylglucosamine repressor
MERYALKKVKSASNSRDLKVLNRLLVLNTIRRNGPVARYEVAKITGLTPPTVTVIVSEMIKWGVVKETGAGESNGGRRPVFLKLESNAGFIFAVRLQSGEIMAALMDITGNILESRYLKLDTKIPEAVVAAIRECLDQFIQRTGVPRERVLWCGVASPGLIDIGQSTVVRSFNLGWNKAPLGEMLSQSLSGIRVHIENISNAAALGEKVYGSGRGLPDLIYLNLSVGIGAGMIINHQVYNGTQGYAGEVGHMTLVPEAGPQCLCGRYGCFEAFCGIGAVLERIKTEASPECFEEWGVAKHRFGFDDLSIPFIRESPVIKTILADVENYIGIAIANLVSLFNIPQVILGGEMVGVLSLDAINEKVKARLFPEIGETVRVVGSVMREDPPLMGVYALVLEKVFASDQWLESRFEQ